MYRIIPDKNRIASPAKDWNILFFASVTACWSPAAAEICIPETTKSSTAIMPTTLAPHLYIAPMYVYMISTPDVPLITWIGSQLRVFFGYPLVFTLVERSEHKSGSLMLYDAQSRLSPFSCATHAVTR